MPDDAVTRRTSEIEVIRAIAESDADAPVLMINLNRYAPAAGFPDGTLYRSYMDALDALLPQVGAKILWRSRVQGQPVGAQPIDEILAAWYPTHRAFLDLTAAPGAERNFALRRRCVEYAVIHRCAGDRPPLDGSSCPDP